MLKAGEQAPQFAINNLEGDVKRSSDYLKLGPALLVFYKASCPVCQLTLPFLERLRDVATLRFVLISQDDAKTTAKFRQHFKLTMDTLLDERGYPASNAYGIEHVPSLFLVQPAGTIEKSWEGFSRAEMEALGTNAGKPIFHVGENVPLYKPG